MAIQTFKEIIDNKAYRISSKDREIFEQGTLQSFFGFSNSDMIEFIMYDANDNQLPQQEDGKLARYIPLSSENIKDYFLIPTGTYLQAFNFPNEYFIDAERLIKEAGYNNGIFKVQISLLNKRVGSDGQAEKLWIKQISPSKTEVKLLPLKTDTSLKTDLLERFNIMVNGGDFRDDIQPYIMNFVNNISVEEASGFIRKIYGEQWYKKFINEFGISSFDEMITKIHKKFVEAMQYESINRISSINDVNYGKPKAVKNSLKLSVDDVFKLANTILIDCIKIYLPKRAIQYKTQEEEFFDESFDDTPKILQRRESDVVIEPKPPQTTVTKTKDKSSKDVAQERERKEKFDDGVASGVEFSKPTKNMKYKPVQQPVNNTSTGTTSGGGRRMNDGTNRLAQL